MVDDTQKSDSLKEIPASKILAKIEKGKPVVCDHVRIIGDPDLSKPNQQTEHQRNILKIPAECKIVFSSIEIANSKFDVDIDFSNCQFRDQIQFKNTTFGGSANFKEATFSAHIERRDPLLENTFEIRFLEASFEGAKFNEDANFGDANFKDATFSRSVYFGYATFGQTRNYSIPKRLRKGRDLLPR